MNEGAKTWVSAIFLLALTLLCVFLMRYVSKLQGGNIDPTTITDTIYKTDTLYIRDTIIVDRPSAIQIKHIRDTILYAIHDTIEIVKIDSVKVPVVTAEYRNSNYYARVEGGYFARLDKIEIYNNERIISQTKIKKSKIAVVAGVGAGVGNDGKVKGFIGITAGIPIWQR